MNGINLLQSRNRKNIIVSAFIDRTLQDEARRLKADQDRVFANSNDRVIDHVKNNRSYTVANNTLTHTHAIQQRFIDMKRIQGRSQKPVQGHNKPIYIHWNSILFRLRYELTESLRATIATNLKIDIDG